MIMVTSYLPLRVLSVLDWFWESSNYPCPHLHYPNDTWWGIYHVSYWFKFC
jgi:hypothetical protein